ncbi:SPOR domain-containing protein [Psychrobacter phenylpyruvicus]|uniref:Cell division protein FtsN n=1 Tax=Psychrobacter phenylpyruvicus TaxID=29432 RepID=A0A379LMH0_9GAMM|nr:SPOR domain-containing protein [Psychrobacter phenylpyruvicus]SUD91743.1 cell division protein FtsN [Psychrobacter phenylpyruvicus]
MLAKRPKGKGTVERRQSGGAASLLWMFVGAVLTVGCILVLYLWNPFDIGSESKVEERTVEPINQPMSETNDFEFYDLLPDQEMISLPDEAIFIEDEPAGSAGDLQPDVVLTQPNTEARDSSDRGSDNFGISEERTISPAPNQQAPSGEQDIVIVEEEGTYDDPTEGNQGAATRVNKSNSASQAAAKSAPAKSYILQINSFSSAEEADKRRAQVLMAGVDAHVVKSKMANGQVVYQVVSPTMTNRQKVMAAQQRLQNNGIDSLVVEQRR